jgi:hypothetical protein
MGDRIVRYPSRANGAPNEQRHGRISASVGVLLLAVFFADHVGTIEGTSMWRFLKQRLDIAFVAFAIPALALSSCHSGGSNGYVPQQQTPVGAQITSSYEYSDELFPPDPTLADGAAALPVPLPEELIPLAMPAKSPPCPTEAVPGTYTTIAALGTVSKTTFTANTTTAGSGWERIKYVVATPTPKASPTPKSSPTPKPQPEYLYEGTYTLKDGSKTVTVGCASLLTTQNGSDLKFFKFNGLNGEFPIFTKLNHATVVSTGKITKLTITGLSATSGSGTFTLSNKFTGTLKITSRLTIP